MTDQLANVRYIVDDVEAAIAFYVEHLGFELRLHVPPAFADVRRGALRLLLSGPASSGGRELPDGRRPEPGGWNRIQIVVEDFDAELARLRERGAPVDSDPVSGPGGRQVLLRDPAGNLVEVFEPRAQE